MGREPERPARDRQEREEVAPRHSQEEGAALLGLLLDLDDELRNTADGKPPPYVADTTGAGLLGALRELIRRNGLGGG